MTPSTRDGGELAVNVKVYGPAWDAGAASEWPGLTEQWAAALPESDRDWAWEEACRFGWERAGELACETFGPTAEVWSAGRSGGWLTVEVDGRPLTEEAWEEWGEDERDKWRDFARQVRALADDTPYQYTWLIGANIWEPAQEAARKREEAAAACREFWGSAPYGQEVEA